MTMYADAVTFGPGADKWDAWITYQNCMDQAYYWFSWHIRTGVETEESRFNQEHWFSLAWSAHMAMTRLAK